MRYLYIFLLSVVSIVGSMELGDQGLPSVKLYNRSNQHVYFSHTFYPSGNNWENREGLSPKTSVWSYMGSSYDATRCNVMVRTESGEVFGPITVDCRNSKEGVTFCEVGGRLRLIKEISANM